MGRIRRLSWIAGLFAISVIGACDDGGKGPLAPTPGSPPPATISGIVKNLAAQSPPISSSFRTVGTIGMTVTVIGINVGAVADADGRFTLTGVRPGPVQLQFTGAGVDAVLDLQSVRPGENVNIVVTVDGTTAVLVTKSSSEDEDADEVDGSDSDDQDSDDADDQEDDDADDTDDDDTGDNDD